MNDYATRSAAADKRAAGHHSTRHRRILCADAMHQNRPGGTDYHGPAVPGCPERRFNSPPQFRAIDAGSGATPLPASFAGAVPALLRCCGLPPLQLAEQREK